MDPRQKTGGGGGANLAASVREILSEVDKDNDGRIDYQEFCDMMRGQVGPPQLSLVACLGPLIQGSKTCMQPAHSVFDLACNVVSMEILLLPLAQAMQIT